MAAMTGPRHDHHVMIGPPDNLMRQYLLQLLVWERCKPPLSGPAGAPH